MTTTLVVYQRDDGLYDWRLMAANGEEIASSASQGYTQRNDAREGWERVVKADRGRRSRLRQDGEREGIIVTLADLQAQLAQAQKDLTQAQQAVVDAQTHIADLQTQIEDLTAAATRTWLGVWCHGPSYATWKNVRTFAPQVTAYRRRGDGLGRLDFGFSDPGELIDLASSGQFVLSANINPRLGVAPKKQGISLKDVANGKYDADLVKAGKMMAPFDRGCCEIWSECNVIGNPTQPTPLDYSMTNWEAAFLHVVDVLKAQGVKIALGTSIAGPSAIASWRQYVTPKIVAASGFFGFDFYDRDTKASQQPISAAAVALKAVADMSKAAGLAKPLPLVVTESGVSKTLGAAHGASWFGEAAQVVKSTPPGLLMGWFINDGDQPDGAYVIDVGSVNHASFIKFAGTFQP